MPAAVAVVTGAADRRRRDRRPCPCPLRAGGLCAVRGEAPLLICSGAAGRRGRLPYGGSTRFMGVQLGGKGHRGRFTGLRLRCGDWRAAAGGCHCASLMMKRCAAAAAVRPCVRPDPGSPLSPFPQVTCLDWLGGPVLPPLSACGMRARRALAVLVWSGDGSPVWGCTTTGGVQVPPRTPSLCTYSGLAQWSLALASPLVGRSGLASPGGPGESHPRAPTERSVKVSLHSARPIYRLYLKSVIHVQCANRRGCLVVSPSHHLRTFLNVLSRLYFRLAQRTR